jgi:hypothetical protein
MAQCDVFASPGSSAADDIPCEVVIQGDQLDALPTRLTVPPALLGAATKVPTALCPVVAVKRKRRHALAH